MKEHHIDLKAGFSLIILIPAILYGCTRLDTARTLMLEIAELIDLSATLPDTALGTIADYRLTSAGEIVIADGANRRLLFVDRQGSFRRTVGRRGQGPLEFMFPAGIVVIGDTLLIRDLMNPRLQYLDLHGRLLKMVQPSHATSGVLPVTFGPDGRCFQATYGIGSSGLLSVFYPGSESMETWGTLEADATSVFLMGIPKEDARSRRIPDPFRNRVIPIPTSDRGVIVAHDAIPLVKKLGPGGVEMWRVELALAEFDTIRTETFDSILQETGMRAYPLRYWRGATADDAGGCYLQVNRPGRLLLYHLDREGRISGPMVSEDASLRGIRFMEGRLWSRRVDPPALVVLQSGGSD